MNSIIFALFSVIGPNESFIIVEKYINLVKTMSGPAKSFCKDFITCVIISNLTGFSKYIVVD